MFIKKLLSSSFLRSTSDAPESRKNPTPPAAPHPSPLTGAIPASRSRSPSPSATTSLRAAPPPTTLWPSRLGSPADYLSDEQQQEKLAQFISKLLEELSNDLSRHNGADADAERKRKHKCNKCYTKIIDHVVGNKDLPPGQPRGRTQMRELIEDTLASSLADQKQQYANNPDIMKLFAQLSDRQGLTKIINFKANTRSRAAEANREAEAEKSARPTTSEKDTQYSTPTSIARPTQNTKQPSPAAPPVRHTPNHTTAKPRKSALKS
jgi:hypothetical protein